CFECLLTIKRLGKSPPGINPRKLPQAANRPCLAIEAVVPVPIGYDGAANTRPEYLVEPASSRRSSDPYDRPDQIRNDCRPTRRCHRAHRPPGDEAQTRDAELLHEQSPLCIDVVVGHHPWKTPFLERWGGIARR